MKETRAEKKITSNRVSGAYIYSHEEAFHGALFLHSRMSIKHFITLCLVSANEDGTVKGKAKKSVETKLTFFIGSYKQFSRFNRTFI